MNKIRTMIRSYKALRTVVGVIGILLPLALILGNWGLEKSISQFYYTNMRNLFVGALSAVSMFMFFYVGYDKVDNWLANAAGVFALAVPFFPCEGWTRPYHLVSAALLFGVFGVFSYFRFSKSGPTMTKMKIKRNVVYELSGITIFTSLIVLLIYFLFNLNIPNFIFWIEVLMLEAFGISWLVKGEVILKDKDVII